MNHQPLPQTFAQRLNESIQIESLKINRRPIVYRVSFCFDPQLLAEIEQIKAIDAKLKLSSKNLANLRHYALKNLPLAAIYDDLGRHKSNHNNSALTFTTQYIAAPDRPAIAVLRSAIDPEGKISQQVRQDLYQDTLLLTRISQAHHWLVLEILTQLPLKTKAWYSSLVCVCFFIGVAIACSLVWYLIPLTYLFKIVICLCLIMLAKLSFKPFIIPKLKAGITYHLLDGLFAKGSNKKKIGLKILSFLIACN